MKIVRLRAGLGNQMFQYAFAKVLQKTFGEPIYLDCSFYKKYSYDFVRPSILDFDLTLMPCTNDDINSLFKNDFEKIVFRIVQYPSHGEKIIEKFNFTNLLPFYYREFYRDESKKYVDPECFKKFGYVDGYFINCDYVDLVSKEIRRDFNPYVKLSKNTLETCKEVKSVNSVFIGVRRGDYLKNRRTINTVGILSMAWFELAMNEIEKRIHDPIYYIFSNDIAWCMENFKHSKRHFIFRKKEDQTSDFEELMIMRSCRHSIISNSTYHWWGAYLDERPDKIIVAPQPFFRKYSSAKVVPDRWISLDQV